MSLGLNIKNHKPNETEHNRPKLPDSSMPHQNRNFWFLNQTAQRFYGWFFRFGSVHHMSFFWFGSLGSWILSGGFGFDFWQNRKCSFQPNQAKREPPTQMFSPTYHTLSFKHTQNHTNLIPKKDITIKKKSRTKKEKHMKNHKIRVNLHYYDRPICQPWQCKTESVETWPTRPHKTPLSPS